MLSIRPRAWRVVLAVSVPLLGLAVIACGSAASGPILSTVGSAVGGAVAPGASAAPAGNPSGGDQAGSGNNANGSGDVTNGAQGPDLLIIKTGTLQLQVTGIDEAIGRATDLVDGLGGYASGSDRSGDGDTASATITYRIPATKWDEALKGLSAIGQKVLGERSQTQDVTGQVVDLGARIRNLEATERALQAIMDRAKEIKDVLTVQAELTKVRGDIEQMTGDKLHLEEQAAMSTLTVSLALKPPSPVVAEQQGFDPGAEAERASASLVSVLQGVATAGIWFGIVWLPILVFFSIVGLVAWFVFRRTRRYGPGAGGQDPGGSGPQPGPSGPAEPTAVSEA